MPCELADCRRFALCVPTDLGGMVWSPSIDAATMDRAMICLVDTTAVEHTGMTALLHKNVQ